MSPRLRSVCVFCASSDGAAASHREAAASFGALLAAHHITLVYGGGRVGLMGALADGALRAGGRVEGVIPRAMIEAERGHTGLAALHVVTTMHERKARMVDLADGFVALPGGFGTFDELFEVITWAQLGIHGKPIGVLDVGGLYAPLMSFLDHVVAAGFIQARFRSMALADTDPDRLLARMANHTPPTGSGWARP